MCERLLAMLGFYLHSSWYDYKRREEHFQKQIKIIVQAQKNIAEQTLRVCKNSCNAWAFIASSIRTSICTHVHLPITKPMRDTHPPAFVYRVATKSRNICRRNDFYVIITVLTTKASLSRITLTLHRKICFTLKTVKCRVIWKVCSQPLHSMTVTM